MTLFDSDVFLRCHSIITDKRPFYFDSHKNAEKHGKEETRRCVSVKGLGGATTHLLTCGCLF